MTGADPAAFAALAGELIAASVLGGAIGAQRQATHKPAGFRTHLLVALGSCAFMEASRLAGDSRIGAGVITGIGFLGAGSIVREGVVPRGLTTAASIWVVAAIGLALGFGTPLAFGLALATTVLTLVALSISDRRLEALFPRREGSDVRVTFDPDALAPERLIALAANAGLRAKRARDFAVDKRDGVRTARCRLTVHAPRGTDLAGALLALSADRAVHGVETIDGAQP